MFGGEPANMMGDILAAAGATVNDGADISAFIDLSVLIRDFLCIQPRKHGRVESLRR